MQKPLAVVEAEEVAVELRQKADAKPEDADLQMQARMAERTAEVTRELNAPRPHVTQDHIDACARLDADERSAAPVDGARAY
jgi:hypothetical protein